MIYNLAISPYEDWHRQAWAAGLVLLGLVLIANIAARWVLAEEPPSKEDKLSYRPVPESAKMSEMTDRTAGAALESSRRAPGQARSQRI